MEENHITQNICTGCGGWVKQTLVFDAGAPAVTQNGDGGAHSRRSACMCCLQLGARRMVITDARVIHDNPKSHKHVTTNR